MNDRLSVGVVGGGALGVGFALRVALAGHVAHLYEQDPSRCADISDAVSVRLDMLDRHDVLEEDAAAIAARVVPVAELTAVAEDAALVQECATERLDLKRHLIADLAEVLAPDVPLASSSSALSPSQIFSGTRAERVGLVGHPLNPPYVLPIIEVVPTPQTSLAVVDRAEDVYRALGLRPVRLHREIGGFVTNRLQAALLREAYLLVADGVVDVDDLDAVVRDGLGQRWSFMGPFETADLNTRGGIGAHTERLGASYGRFGLERDGRDPWATDIVDTVAAARRSELPLADWEERVRWRDEELVRRLAVRRAKDLGQNDERHHNEE